MQTNEYYIIEELFQGKWYKTAPSTNRHTMEYAKERLEYCKKHHIGLDGVEDFRMCKVVETITPVA